MYLCFLFNYILWFFVLVNHSHTFASKSLAGTLMMHNIGRFNKVFCLTRIEQLAELVEKLLFNELKMAEIKFVDVKNA